MPVAWTFPTLTEPVLSGLLAGLALLGLLLAAAGAALVDWRWDSVCQRVNGVVLQDNQLLPFRWWPSHNRFELRTAIMQIRPLG